MSDIEIEIDGKKLNAKPNQMIIQVADEAGVYIPRFCYHKHLSIAANCRMCLVEVDKVPKALPACATPVAPGMKVFTKSKKTIEAQRAVMEFLLINHPLDCPVCDQGGECELQDLAMGYGSSHSHYDECKRSVADQDLGPLIDTEMTRCIQCTRCVRFGDEVAGMRELGVTNRGEHAEISTYVQQSIKSEVSGNIIDICPVGALTSKPYRFTARAWEMKQAPSIAPHDCMGSNINVHTLTGGVKRVVPRENDMVNETWISDRDRFSYAGLDHADRLKELMIQRDGEWKTASWEEALKAVSAKLQDTIREHGPDALGALASPSSTLEEFYLLQKIIRGLGSPHVDHRLREIDTRDQASFPSFPGFGMSPAEMEEADAVLLIGSNLQKEQPLMALRLRKAIQKGAVALVINPVDYQFNFDVAAKDIVAPHVTTKALSDLLKAIQQNQDHPVATQLRDKQKINIILGAFVSHHPDAAVIRSLAHKIATLTKASLTIMTDGANSAGGWLAGMIPHRQAAGAPVKEAGLSAYEMAINPRKAYCLLNVEPDLDVANTNKMIEALKQAKCVIALSVYRNPVLEKYADVILPVAPFTETAGTFVNAAGAWQSFTGVAKAFESSRPAWKVLRVLGNFLHLEGFEYEDAQQIRHELLAQVENVAPVGAQFADMPANSESKGISRIGEVLIYSTDALVRRSEPLANAQTIMQGEAACVRMHPDTVKKLNLNGAATVVAQQGSAKVALPLVLDSTISRDAAWLPGAIEEAAKLGDLLGEIEIVSER